jgi:hypothetical protein
MTTLAEARDELIAALVAADVRATDNPGGIDPPYVAVLGNGIDLGHIVRNEAEASFRSVCIAGAADNTGAVDQLDALKLATIAVLRSLAGWRLGEVRADGLRSYQGSEYLTADVTASRFVTIS